MSFGFGVWACPCVSVITVCAPGVLPPPSLQYGAGSVKRKLSFALLREIIFAISAELQLYNVQALRSKLAPGHRASCIEIRASCGFSTTHHPTTRRRRSIEFRSGPASPLRSSIACSLTLFLAQLSGGAERLRSVGIPCGCATDARHQVSTQMNITDDHCPH